jgi:hypothetical protein
MKQCPYCNAQIADDSKFCGECGKEYPQGNVCPKCGATVNEGDIYCEICGRNLKDGSYFSGSDGKPSIDYMKMLLSSFIGIIVGIVILAIIGGSWYGCNEYAAYKERTAAREKFVADSLEKARKDSIEAVKQKEEKERLEKEKKLKMEACLNYVKKFYRDYEKTNQDEDFLRKHCTPNAIRILEEAYDYDCEGSCLATWIFFYEAGSDAELVKREFVAKDENTCVVNNINNYNGTYSVTIGVVEENGKLKINSISTNYY